MNGMLNLAVLQSQERHMLRTNWMWFVVLGVVLTLLGIFGLIFAAVTTWFTMVFVGWIFLIAGIAEVLHAIVRKGWSGFWLDLLSGFVTAVVGLLILMHPLQGASVPTLLIGIMFVVGGIFRIGAGIAVKNPYAGWFVLHGVISSILGIMIIGEWPQSALWVIGVLVAVDLLFGGIRLIAFGFAAKNLPVVGDDSERTPEPAPPVA